MKRAELLIHAVHLAAGVSIAFGLVAYSRTWYLDRLIDRLDDPGIRDYDDVVILRERSEYSIPRMALVLDSDARTSLRAEVAALMGSTLDPAALPHLARFADDPAPEVRAGVAGGLGNLASPEALEHLLPLADDPDPRVRTAVLRGLTLHDPGRALDVAIDAATDPDEAPAVREAAFALLERWERRETFEGAPRRVRRVREALRTREPSGGEDS